VANPAPALLHFPHRPLRKVHTSLSLPFSVNPQPPAVLVGHPSCPDGCLPCLWRIRTAPMVAKHC